MKDSDVINLKQQHKESTIKKSSNEEWWKLKTQMWNLSQQKTILTVFLNKEDVYS